MLGAPAAEAESQPGGQGMPAAPRAPHALADVVFRVGRTYGMTADCGIYQAFGLRGFDSQASANGAERTP
jgi:hypothetical protein